jgi:hypothetical protein
MDVSYSRNSGSSRDSLQRVAPSKLETIRSLDELAPCENAWDRAGEKVKNSAVVRGALALNLFQAKWGAIGDKARTT